MFKISKKIWDNFSFTEKIRPVLWPYHKTGLHDVYVKTNVTVLGCVKACFIEHFVYVRNVYRDIDCYDTFVSTQKHVTF
jgi:hypothetical protein